MKTEKKMCVNGDECGYVILCSPEIKKMNYHEKEPKNIKNQAQKNQRNYLEIKNRIAEKNKNKQTENFEFSYNYI